MVVWSLVSGVILGGFDSPQPFMDTLLHINVERAFNTRFGRFENLNVFCPFHENPQRSQSPSCSVSVMGVFNCKVCNARGTALQFYAAVNSITLVESIKQLSSYIPITNTTPRIEHILCAPDRTKWLTDNIVDTCHRALLTSTFLLDYLRIDRGLTANALHRYRIGCDEYRITIPVYDIDGTLLNVRRYLPYADASQPKMVSHLGGNASPMLYPYSVIAHLSFGDELIICEGEWDALLLNQKGFPAVTNTGNVSTWHEDWTGWVKHYRLVIVYDVNDIHDNLGQRMAHIRADEFLSAGAHGVKVVELPLTEVGGDITDYFVKHGHRPAQFRELIAQTDTTR